MANHSNSVNFFALFVLAIIISLVDRTTQQGQTFDCGPPVYLSYPQFIAHIKIRRFADSQLFVCGGTLISDQHVLTAAHCLQDNNSAGLNTILNITLPNGYPDVNVENVNHQIFGMKSVAIQSNWNIESDIAIVTLSRPVIFTNYVVPACLPFEDDPDHDNYYGGPGYGESNYLSGWGVYDSSNTFSSTLNYDWAYVLYLPSEECQQTVGVGNFSSDNVICSDGNPTYRYYYGDDGGPFMNWHHDCNRWFVIGVFGRGELYNLNYKPNVFTRVRAHLDFIRRETGVASPTACKNSTVSTSTQPTTSTTPTTTITEPPTTDMATTKITEFTEETTTTRPTSPTTTLPSTTSTTNPVPFDCKGKADGNYPNPASDCSITFYMCSNGDAYLFTCPQALTVYRPEIYACDWPSNVAGCN